MTQSIVGGAIGVMDAGIEHRSHGDDLLWRAIELCRTLTQTFQPMQQHHQRLSVEAGSNLAAIVQFTIDPFAERKGCQPLGRLRDCVAGDDEIVLFQRLGFAPAVRAPGV
jgi:hypothetical protein